MKLAPLEERGSPMDELRLIELVELAQTGDRDAFGELVKEFETSVFAIVLKRLRNRSEAREVTQEVFLRAMRKISQLREANRFGGWLRRIAVRLAINRAVRRPPECTAEPETLAHQNAHSEAPLDDLLTSERADQVRGGLQLLGDLDRETLIAFYFEGQSLKEMSDQFERPIGTIKRRLHTARHRLRSHLQELQPA